MKFSPNSRTFWLCLATLSGAAFADSPTIVATQNSRLSGARIDHAAAERTALAQIPGGHVISSELEREHGRLIWSFDISLPGSRDIREVHVSARSGRVLSVTTETAVDQAREASAEAPPTPKK